MGRLFCYLATKGARDGQVRDGPDRQLKHRFPAKLLPLVEEYREKLTADQGGRQPLEKEDDAKDLRKPLKAAATSLTTLETPAPRSVKCRKISGSGRGAAG
jgi:hypothetical protein